MSKKIWLSSRFDCLIKKEEKEFFLKAEVSKVCILLESDDYFFVYPTNEGISFVVTMQEDKLIENGHFLVEKNFDDEFEMTLLPFLICDIPSKSFSHKTGDYTQTVFLGKDILYCLKHDQTQYFCKLRFQITDFRFVNFKNIPLLVVNGEQEKLVYFDTKTEKFCVLSGSIEIEGDSIKITSPLCDMAHRAKVVVLEEADNNLTTKSSDLVYLDGKPQVPSEEGLIGYAFFEAVKAKDFACAKSMLGKNFDVQNMKVLEEYFGEFDKIKPYNYNREKGYFFALGNNGKNKIYKVKITDNKISEIEKLERENGADKLC